MAVKPNTNVYRTQARIIELKERLAKAMTTYHRIAEPYDCGHALFRHINPKAGLLAAEVNEALDELRTLDPSCPAGAF